MPEDLGEHFYIHAALNGTSGKGMPEGMKAFMRDIRLFQKQLEAALIGADGNGLPVCGHHEGRIAPFFQRFEDGQQLFRERDHAAGSGGFRIVDDKPALAVKKRDSSVVLASGDYIFREDDHVIVAGAFKNVDRLKH